MSAQGIAAEAPQELGTDDESLTGTLLVTAEEQGVGLALALDAKTAGLKIVQARHSGVRSPAQERVLSALCREIIGHPIQDAADHGAIYAMAQVPNRAGVQGILTPRNAGPHFALAERLLRKAFAAAQVRTALAYKENRWQVRVSAKWFDMGEVAQAAALKPFIARFLAERDVHPDDLWISAVERGVRVTIAFTPAVPNWEKPQLLLSLERALRNAVNEPLELFMEEMKDANRIRRL